MSGQRDIELRNALYLAQYQSVREVVLHARQIQHSVVAWSSAAAGVLVGSGAVLAGNGLDAVTRGTSGTTFFLLFALALPGLAASSFNAWIGEIARMRRAASFLRDIEYTVHLSTDIAWPPGPTYDTVVSRGPNAQGDSVTKIGRRAVAALYVGLYAASTGVASLSLWNFDLPTDHPTWLRIAGQVLILLCLAWFLRAVRDGFRTVAPYARHTPTRMDAEFAKRLFAIRDDQRATS